jgi:class 3 adenylate cyclase
MTAMNRCAACGAPFATGTHFCSSCGASLDEQPQAADERKLATVLFADLTGSTETADLVDPERTRAMLDRFYDAMAAEIERAGGTVEKFVGDAVMAAFGVPVAHEDDAERALHCAVSMQRRMGELFESGLALRIGVNTGEVVAGRSRERSSFVSGDTVNVTFRLQEAAGPGEILVGERTATAARGAFEFGDPSTVEAKGKPDGVPCRRLLRTLSLMRSRGIRGRATPFVGRESDLALLQATYERVVAQNEPHLVTLVGDPGIGKTRLVRELWAWIGSQDAQPLRRTGRCLPYGDAVTYWPLGEVLREHFGLLESDPPERLRQVLPDEILALALGLDLAGDLHPLAARDRLYDATIRFIGDLTAARPTAILIEDLHWAEEPLLDLLELLLREVRGPFLVIGTTRPELFDRRPRWSAVRNYSSLLWLEPLTPEDATRMADALIDAPLPDEFQELIARAEGNPFFVEELLGTLIDEGAVEPEGNRWRLGKLPPRFALPDSVQAVLAARIDLLEPTEKEVLQLASVIGLVFWPKPIYELLSGGEPNWALLEHRDFIRRRPSSSLAGETEYAFKHALTRDVAYASLPKARRAQLHGAFASWLERYGGGRDEHVPHLAHHYSAAVRPEDVDLAWAGRADELNQLRKRARSWLRRAADLAVSRYEIDAAVELLERALGLEPPEDESGGLWWAIGRASALKYDGEAFWHAMQQAATECSDPVALAEISSELSFQTAARSGMWRHVPADAVVLAAIERALTLSPPLSPAYVRALVARSFWRPRDAGREATQALQLAQELENVELLSYALDASSLTSYAVGDYGQAYADSRRRLELSDRITDPDHLAHMRESGVAACLGLGLFAEARELAREHSAIAAELTPHHQLHGVALQVEVEELAGDWEAICALEPAVERAVAANLATPCIRNARSLLVCAVARERLGEREASLHLEAEATELEPAARNARLALSKIQIALLRGEPDRVEALLTEPIGAGASNTWFLAPWLATRLLAMAALDDLRGVEEEAPPLLQPTTYLEPFALRALGMVRRDPELLGQAESSFQRMGLSSFAEETTRLIAALV